MTPTSVSDGNSASHTDDDRSPDSWLNEMVAQVEEFFSYRPPTFTPGKSHSKSDKTRTPAKFDRHLHSSLRLCCVVYLPSIVDDLKALAEGALQSAAAARKLPSNSDNFPDPNTRQTRFDEFLTGAIRGEQHLQTIYSETTARFCGVVASTLEFQHPHWNRGHLEWTLDSNKSRGVADGFLRLNDMAVDKAVAPLSDKYKDVAEDFPVLGIWEFKSLIAGSPEVFEAIVQQSAGAGGFHWEGCKAGVRCPIAHGRPGEEDGLYVTGSKTAFDASREAETCRSTLAETRITPSAPTSQISEAAKIHARDMTQQVLISLYGCFH